MYTQQQIKALLDGGMIPIDQDNIIKKGLFTKQDGSSVAYDIYCGWDFSLARACDREWGLYNIKLMQFIEEQEYDSQTLTNVLDQVQLDDSHWDWLGKSIAYHTNEYVWFFVVADGKPQGACLIYHPQKSATCANNIFYVEYVAVAPWNRKNPISERVFFGIGSILIKTAIMHATAVLRLKHGFSLHALEKAAPFYLKIGMTPHPGLDKPRLQYFEMPETTAVEYLTKP